VIGVRVQCAACGKVEEIAGTSTKIVEELMERCRQAGWLSTPEGWQKVWKRPVVVACSADCADAAVAKVREEALEGLRKAFAHVQLDPIR
jgi:hypothetical protein